MHVNSPAWVEENQLKCEKGRFLSEVSEINSWWVIFNLLEWTLFKSVYYMFLMLKSLTYLKHTVLVKNPMNFLAKEGLYLQEAKPEMGNSYAFLLYLIILWP